MNIPETLPTLASGSHDAGDRQLCAMEAASFLAAEEHSDHPKCVHHVLAAVARNVNDSVDDATRQTLWPLLIKCLGTASDDRTVDVRMAAWSAEQVLEFVRPSDWQVCRDAITAAQNWADNPCDETAASAASAASAANSAAGAHAAHAHAAYAHAAHAAHAAYAYAASAASAANAINPNQAKVHFLSNLIDYCYEIQGLTESTPSENDWNRVLEFVDG